MRSVTAEDQSLGPVGRDHHHSGSVASGNRGGGRTNIVFGVHDIHPRSGSTSADAIADKGAVFQTGGWRAAGGSGPCLLYTSFPFVLAHDSWVARDGASPVFTGRFSTAYEAVPRAEPEETDSFRPGSNNWVVSGQHTVSGKPLLSNDMHLDHQMPNLWFAAHLRVSGGNFDVAGVTLPGVPFVIVGHNQRIGLSLIHI